MRLCFLVIFFMAGGCVMSANTMQVGARRDAESFATASCLYQLDKSYLKNQPYLKEQADAWAGAVIQRTHLDVVNDLLGGIHESIHQEIAKGDMAIGRSEKVGEPGKALPLLYCGEISDRPLVREAIEKAVSRLGR